MNLFCVTASPRREHFSGRGLIRAWALLFCCCTYALAQSAPHPVNANAPFSVRVTHLLGLENTKNNCNGTLSIQDNALLFQQRGKPGAKVEIASVRDVFVGGESKQVGGLPMKLGKATAPYGGGRVVSLFAHKKYDTLTVEYADGDGGIHGIVFQLKKGEGERVRQELVGRGVSAIVLEKQPTKNTVEVTHASK